MSKIECNGSPIIPTVNIDGNLMLHRPLKFDSSIIGTYLRSEKGLDDEAIAHTIVDLRLVSGKSTGYYSPSEGKITANLNRRTSEKRANKILYHELEHRVDDHNSKLGRLVPYMVRMPNLLMLSEIPAGVVTIISALEKLPILEYISAGVGLAFFGGVFGTIGAYRFSKEERRARQAAKMAHEPIISFTNK